MDSSQNGPIEVPIWETHFEWEVVEMVDPISRIRFEVCGMKNYQKKHDVKC